MKRLFTFRRTDKAMALTFEDALCKEDDKMTSH